MGTLHNLDGFQNNYAEWQKPDKMRVPIHLYHIQQYANYSIVKNKIDLRIWRYGESAGGGRDRREKLQRSSRKPCKVYKHILNIHKALRIMPDIQ